MQEYLFKHPLRDRLDALGFHALMLFLCCGWFLLLWGLRLQSLLAGLGFYGLCLLVRHKTRDHRLARKEKKLRRRIGGEMKLQSLLMQPGAHAHFECAMLLSMQENFQLERMTEAGVLCRKDGRLMLVSFLQLPSSEKATARDVLHLQQAAKALLATEVRLCVPCGLGMEARAQGEQEIPVHFLEREGLIALFGAAAPATDAQLVALGRQKKKKMPLQKLGQVLFAPEKSKRYALYGGMLLLLYTLTGLLYYAVPGLICLSLATISHCRNRR